MSHSKIVAFDTTVQSTYQWIHTVQDELEWPDARRAYHALRAVLHALRDRLSAEQVATLASQMPMLVRGFYYEGWQPSAGPLPESNLDDLLAHVAESFRGDPDFDPEAVTRGVLRALSRRVGEGVIDSIECALPAELRTCTSTREGLQHENTTCSGSVDAG